MLTASNAGIIYMLLITLHLPYNLSLSLIWFQIKFYNMCTSLALLLYNFTSIIVFYWRKSKSQRSQKVKHIPSRRWLLLINRNLGKVILLLNKHCVVSCVEKDNFFFEGLEILTMLRLHYLKNYQQNLKSQNHYLGIQIEGLE